MNKRFQLIRKGMSNYGQNTPKPEEPEIKPRTREPEIKDPSVPENPAGPLKKPPEIPKSPQPQGPDVSPGKTKEPDIPKPAPSEPHE